MEDNLTVDGFTIKINKNDYTASIIESHKTNGSVTIPKFLTYLNTKYKIISIGNSAFNFNKLESLIFPYDSEIKYINSYAISNNKLFTLHLPASLEYIDGNNFSCNADLIDIKVSPNNKYYSVIDNTFLVKKSSLTKTAYDILILARRNIKNVIIPSNIRIIDKYSFSNCKHLQSITFESNSSLESIKDYAFSKAFGPDQIIFPPSLNEVSFSCFHCILNTKVIEFHGKSIKIGSQCFSFSQNLKSIKFPNADRIDFEKNSLFKLSPDTKIYLKRNVKITGLVLNEYKKQIVYIEEKPSIVKKEIKSSSVINKFKPKITFIDNKKQDDDERKKEIKTNLEVNNCKQKVINNIKYEQKESRSKSDMTNNTKERIQKIEKENLNLHKYILYLQSQLHKYEDFVSFEDFTEGKIKNDYNIESTSEIKKSNEKDSSNRIIIDESDEKFHKIISKIGEGSTCEVFKVVDERSGEVFCKKIIKEIRDEEKFRLLKNAIKEIDVAQVMKHPCICKSLGFNLQEEIPRSFKHQQYDDDEEEDEENKTTIALFFELLPYDIKSLIDKKMMNNTLKVRIAIEVAFAMSHIHSLGMIHRDLKIENIMLNNVFESKVIDFGLVHIPSFSESSSSFTKGIGTFYYMSPEMINEENYTNKTDVYSYGIVLYVLFTGKLPKQTMREKLDNVPINFPKISSKISEYCIQLIRRCTAFESNKRPSFDEIISDMFNHSFNLASEIDHQVILSRYQALNRFKSQYEHGQKAKQVQNQVAMREKKKLSKPS